MYLHRGLFIALAALFAAPSSPAAEKLATAERAAADQARIESLEISGNDLEVVADPVSNGGVRVLTRLKGRYDRKNWSLLLKGREIARASDGRFELLIPLTGEVTAADLDALHPDGTLRSETIRIHFPGFDAYLAAQRETLSRRWIFIPAVGVTRVAYRQPSIREFTSFAVTGKVSVLYPLPIRNWDIGGSLYGSVLQAPTGNPDEGIRFFGANLRTGYSLPGIREPWRVSLLAGVYYTTTFATGNRFGFKNMAGPQIFPTVRRTFLNGDSLTGYFKFSPVAEGFGFQDLSSREIAGGLTWTRRVGRTRSFSVSFDVANFRVRQAGNTSREASADSASLSIGLGL